MSCAEAQPPPLMLVRKCSDTIETQVAGSFLWDTSISKTWTIDSTMASSEPGACCVVRCPGITTCDRW